MNYICDVIMLTWNQLDITKRCIESFLSKTDAPSRLIVIDNDSRDGTKEYVASLKDTPKHKVKVVLNKENRGFVGGMNQGIEISSAPYVCLANNDLVFTREWLKEIISVFNNYEKVGVLNPNSNSLGEYLPQGFSLDEFAQDLKNRHSSVFIEMPFCAGFCMVIKREVISRVGGLSPEFAPFFFEDTDFSMKAQNAGFLVGMAKASYVWHKGSSSVNKLGKKKEEFFARSRRIFFKKWGRILRVAWVINDERDLDNSLCKAVEVARGGNFVWAFTKNAIDDKEIIFEKNNCLVHSGIGFIRYGNMMGLLWNILKKKKKYDLIISSDKFINLVFGKLGYVVLRDFDKDRIDSIKMRETTECTEVK